MLYEEDMREVILDTLETRVSSISLLIGRLLEEGYVPNSKKLLLLNWFTVVIHAYENINAMTREQQANIDRIYNTLIRM